MKMVLHITSFRVSIFYTLDEKRYTVEIVHNVMEEILCLYTRVGTLIVATIYLQLIQNR